LILSGSINPCTDGLLALHLLGAERSFSVGLAELREGDTPESLVARADTALYEARSKAAALRTINRAGA